MLRSSLVRSSRRLLNGRPSLVRGFARKTFDGVEDQEAAVDVRIEAEEMKKLAKPMSRFVAREYSSDEMELLNSSAFGTDAVQEDSDDDDDEGDKAANYHELADVHNKEIFANMKGRLWEDSWEIKDEDFTKRIDFDDLPDWTADMASRISQERVKIYDGIPTLEELANIPLPPPPPPSPGQGRGRTGRTGAVEYGKWRAIQLENHITKKVKELAEPEVKTILALATWDDKQDAVDALFERLEADLGEEETVLSLHPRFGEWVEKALQSYLETVAQADDSSTATPTLKTIDEGTKTNESSDFGLSGNSESDSNDERPYEEPEVAVRKITAEDDATAVPLFLELYDPEDVFEEETGEKEEGAPRVCNIPKILYPLSVSRTDKTGRMVEEWQLSAHDTAKRIMLRQCTREAARMLAENKSSRIYIHGREGIGKSAVLTTIVASARKSGYIVLYMPDGDDMRRHASVVRPSVLHKGFYDLSNLSQEICAEFLQCHEKDLEGLFITEEVKDKYFSNAQKKLIPDESKDDLSLVGLLKLGKEINAIAPMCYSSVMEYLMEQEEKPFLIAMDGFNGYHEYSHSNDQFYHGSYDPNCFHPIPYELINVFKFALEAMGIFHNHDSEVLPKKPTPMKRGGIIVATTESHALARKYTNGLTESAMHACRHQYWEAPMKVIEVPRYSILEVEHMVSHYELIGLGKLRFDSGETLMDENEMAFLRMVSGCVGQKFLDACCSY